MTHEKKVFFPFLIFGNATVVADAVAEFYSFAVVVVIVAVVVAVVFTVVTAWAKSVGCRCYF